MKSIGFTFDEKILQSKSLEAFFLKLPQVDSLEIAPHPSILSNKIYKKIVSYTASHHYHVPYFVKGSSFEFFKDDYKKDYTKFLSIIESLRQYSVKTPSLVIHGSSNQSQTEFGLDFLLNFIEKKGLDLKLSIETLPLEENSFGSRADLINIVNKFNHDNLKICLDICHDYYNFSDYVKPKQAFLDKVNYIHMHGLKENKHDSIQYFPIEVLKALDLDVVYNLELLSQFCQPYRDTLVSDLNYIQKHL